MVEHWTDWLSLHTLNFAFNLLLLMLIKPREPLGMKWQKAVAIIINAGVSEAPKAEGRESFPRPTAPAPPAIPASSCPGSCDRRSKQSRPEPPPGASRSGTALPRHPSAAPSSFYR